jgi:diguanylate cyclase (GGDEF)-like protein
MVDFPYVSDRQIDDGYYEYNPELFSFLMDAFSLTEMSNSYISDRYGDYFTSAIPINRGDMVFLLCVDYETDEINTYNRNFITSIIILEVSLFITSIVCGFSIAKMLKNNKNMNARIEAMGYYDSLTKLPNRTKLMETLKTSISNLTPKQFLVAFFIDLDNFKRVNDCEGHLIGDLVLQEVANFLQTCATNYKKISPYGDESANYVARLGGDEFVIIYISNIQEKKDATVFADYIFKEFRKLQKDSRIISTYKVTLSMGIAHLRDNCTDCSILLKEADFAMYQAKKQGKFIYHMYDPEVDQLEMFDKVSFNIKP